MRRVVFTLGRKRAVTATAVALAVVLVGPLLMGVNACEKPAKKKAPAASAASTVTAKPKAPPKPKRPRLAHYELIGQWGGWGYATMTASICQPGTRRVHEFVHLSCYLSRPQFARLRMSLPASTVNPNVTCAIRVDDRLVFHVDTYLLPNKYVAECKLTT